MQAGRQETADPFLKFSIDKFNNRSVKQKTGSVITTSGGLLS